MRIALLTDGIYPYVVGGMQKHSYYLAKYFVQQGIQVILYHTGPLEANTKKLKGFTDNELGFIDANYISFPVSGKYPGHYIIDSYIYSAAIYNELKYLVDIDFIYTQGFSGWKTITEKRKNISLPPVGVNFHGVEMFQTAPNLSVKLQHLLLQEPVKYNIRNADYVFSLGGKLTSIQRKFTSKAIVEIPNGVEQQWLLTPPLVNSHQIRKFVFIGRYERRKGIEELQTVLKELHENLSYEFCFIGPIPADKQIRQKNIKYLGLLKDEEAIKDILRSADVLVCPSYSEGMPTVILEAMASGLAIIATDVGAVNKMVSSNNGWLIPAADKDALKHSILQAINLDEEQLMHKKYVSLNLVEKNYTWNKVIKKTVQIISSIVNQTK